MIDGEEGVILTEVTVEEICVGEEARASTGEAEMRRSISTLSSTLWNVLND